MEWWCYVACGFDVVIGVAFDGGAVDGEGQWWRTSGVGVRGGGELIGGRRDGGLGDGRSGGDVVGVQAVRVVVGCRHGCSSGTIRTKDRAQQSVFG